MPGASGAEEGVEIARLGQRELRPALSCASPPRPSFPQVEIERLLEKDRAIMGEFNTAIGDGNKFQELLLKIFKKKVTRRETRLGHAPNPALTTHIPIYLQVKRQRKGPEGADDEYNSEEEEDDEDDDLDDDLDDEEEEVCPPGCDPALYEKVCELREKRLEQEEVYTDFQKAVEALKKENEMLVKKEKGIDRLLKETETEIQKFQNTKQRALNELKVVVTLQMRQVQHLTPEGKLPKDTSESVVFAASDLQKLRGRIKALKEEKAELRRKQKALHAEHKTLQRAQSGKAEKLDELEARAVDVQMLKFGQLINLEAIESVGVHKGTDELREKVRLLERKQDAQMKQWAEKLKAAKLDLKKATEASTNCLNTVATLFERQQQLEAALNQRQTAAIGGSDGAAAAKKERHHLVQLVKIQAKEVEALKVEINMLRRKGGHVYSAPLPPGAHG